MKSIILLMSFNLVASAVGYTQKVSLDMQDASIEDVFSEIREQTGLFFFFNDSWIEDSKKVSIKVNEEQVVDVLDKCFKDQPYSYRIIENTIIVTRRPNVVVPGVIEPDPFIVSGKVITDENLPLTGATIRIKGTYRGTVCDKEGDFKLADVNYNDTLIVSFLGYKTKEVVIRDTVYLTIILEKNICELQEVSVIATTGYQDIPEERVTGSFETVDNKLYNRVTGTDVVTRLDGITSGLVFDKRFSRSRYNTDDSFVGQISIRGVSTLYSNDKPLIVLDNFPYEGNMNCINPNDVESITVLKDAAAASIWGARAGNGVIVINTKKGAYKQPLKVTFNSNVSVSEKPDLFYLDEISSSDFIDVERFLFGNGYYDNDLNKIDKPPFQTPVVELLARAREGTISEAEANSMIDALRQYDVRNDFMKYIYREAVSQQYALNLSGGENNIRYLLSAGYDKNLADLVTVSSDRFTVRSNVSLRLLKKLEVHTGISYALNNRHDNNIDDRVEYGQSDVYRYARLADDQGNPLAVGRRYRDGYIDTVGQGKLLDWHYYPLEELDHSEWNTKTQDVNLNLGIDYQINQVFKAELKYQYQKTYTDIYRITRQEAFNLRNDINTFTVIDGDEVTRGIPLGDKYIPIYYDFSAQTLRGQIAADKTWNEKHQLAAIAGLETREDRNEESEYGVYGYDENSLTFQNVDYSTPAPTYWGGHSTIQNFLYFQKYLNRYTGAYVNAAYTYNHRYTFSFSARKDASNLFGVAKNRRGKPFWSVGSSWNISKEPFYNLEWMPYLKFRATYGFSGNVNNSVLAIATITHNPASSITNLPYASVNNPPNTELGWETVGALNIGIDFATKGSRLSGSIEYYHKNPRGLIASTPTDPSTGFLSLSLNTADMTGNGVDLSINTVNIIKRDFQWSSHILFNYNRMIVTRYLYKSSDIKNYLGDYHLPPVEGLDADALLALPYGGLDPQTGDPMGYLEGELSTDYVAIIDNAKIEDLIVVGTQAPKYHGSLRNTFSWKGIELSCNMIYKLGHVFKRNNALNYYELFRSGNGAYGSSEFAERWQNPGDENHTDVPSMVYPTNKYRDRFYANYSETAYEKADFIRLEDLTLAYNFSIKGNAGIIRLYAIMSNLNLILWRANKQGIDPEYSNRIPPPRTLSFGLTVNL